MVPDCQKEKLGMIHETLNLKLHVSSLGETTPLALPFSVDYPQYNKKTRKHLSSPRKQ